MNLFGRAVLAATHNPISEGLITRTRPGRMLAERFVAGDDLDSAVPAARTLADAGMTISFDLLGEEVADTEQVKEAAAGYADCLTRIAVEGLQANISVKLTQLGLAIDTDLAAETLDSLAVQAAENGTTVTVDMEDSSFTGATLDVYEDVQRRRGNLGLCVQAMLRRTPDDLDRILPLGGHIRLCKGAYAEPESVAWQGTDEVDAAFLRILEVLMAAEGVRPAIATHDERMITRAATLAERRTNPFEFQMLYGVREPLQRSLVADGHELRIYLPYGSQWYPYLSRRMAERPANTLFFLRALVGGR